MSDQFAGAPKQAGFRIRRMSRAASELQRGVPVVIGGPQNLLILAVETAGTNCFEELRTLSGSEPLLIVAPARASAILRTSVPAGAPAIALSLDHSLQTGSSIQSLIDPMAPQPKVTETVQIATLPDGASAALGLAKIARLLPAVLAVPLSNHASSDLSASTFVIVPESDIAGYKTDEFTGLRQVASAAVPLIDAPDSRVIAFRAPGAQSEHLAILVGQPHLSDAPLVRIHSECFTGDLLGSMRCDCGEQLRGAIRLMAEHGAGVLLYLAQEGRGIGLVNKLRAYGLQDRGLDTMDANRALGWGADERDFLVAAKMLQLMQITRVRLLTNNPEKVGAMQACGIEVVEREPHRFAPNGVNDEYLATKAARFGHMLD